MVLFCPCGEAFKCPSEEILSDRTLFINASNFKCKTCDYSTTKVFKLFYVLLLMSMQEWLQITSNRLSEYLFDEEYLSKKNMTSTKISENILSLPTVLLYTN